MKVLFFDQEEKIRNMADLLSLVGCETSILHESRIIVSEEKILSLIQQAKVVKCVVIEMYFIHKQPEIIRRLLEKNSDLHIIIYTTQQVDGHHTFREFLEQGKIKRWFLKARDSEEFVDYMEELAS